MGKKYFQRNTKIPEEFDGFDYKASLQQRPFFGAVLVLL
jgi:hypothetical protein